MVSCWLILESLHRRRGWRAAALASGAGMAAMLALGMKQNIAGGLVFGALVLASSSFRRLSRFDGLALAGAALAGAALPIVSLIIWAESNGVHLSALWDMTYGFRADALEVITRTSMEAELARADTLASLFIQTGLAATFVWLILSLRHALSNHPSVTLAVLAMLLVDSIGVVLGGSYWTAYLLPLIPPAVLSVAVLVGAEGYVGRWTRGIVVLTAILTVSWLAHFTISRTAGDTDPTAYHIGLAIHEVAHPQDTILPLYGRADIVQASGLSNPYQYLWSLPARVRDPDLTQLRSLLASPARPTWVVEWDSVNTWGIDPEGRLRTLLNRHYVGVGELCGYPVWRSRARDRQPLPAINCGDSWLQIQFG